MALMTAVGMTLVVTLAFAASSQALPAQTLPGGIIERDTIVPGPIPLPATITLPVGKGPFPGVVLVHNATGDGDRDEMSGASRPFRDIAWGLASRGIVVLRYEKRSRVEPSWFARAGFTVFDETVQDAVAAARLLRRQVEIDRTRIYVAGHGLGGIVAPRIAHTEGDLAGIILLAGASETPLADQLEQQLNRQVTAAGADSFKVRNQLQPIRPLINRIRTLTDKDSFDIQPIQGLGGTSPKYWLDLNKPDPASVLRRLKLPLLALQGMKDYQMPPSELDGFLKALGPRQNLTVIRYPTLTHNFTPSDGVPGPKDYLAPKTVDPQVIIDIAEWIKKH
jgi:dienelactone hydrolase